MKTKYSDHTVKELTDDSGSKIEVKRTSTGIFWGIFKDGKPITEFMNCRGSNARKLYREFLRKRMGINI